MTLQSPQTIVFYSTRQTWLISSNFRYVEVDYTDGSVKRVLWKGVMSITVKTSSVGNWETYCRFDEKYRRFQGVSDWGRMESLEQSRVGVDYEMDDMTRRKKGDR